MAKKVTTWKPDTCGCVLHLEWDDEVPAEERVHTAVPFVVTNDESIMPRKVCPIHESLDPTDKEEGKHVKHLEKVLEENQRKNITLGKVKEIIGEDADWEFDANRNVVITTKTKLSKAQEDSIKDALSTTSKEKVILK